MSKRDFKNVPLFVFLRQQGERIGRYSQQIGRYGRRFSKSAAPHWRRMRHYWRDSHLLASMKARIRHEDEPVVDQMPDPVLQEVSPKTLPAPDFMQILLQRSLSPRLHALLALRSAVRIACPATIQLKERECVMHGWSAEQISAVQDGVIHPDFTASERLLLRYADDVTRTPIDVDLQVFRELRRHFTPEQIAEATASICYENFRTRYSNAMGTDLGQHEKPSANVSMEEDYAMEFGRRGF
ncbi:MAG: carboxymuconolactone decarboxylase family protein [Bryobacteraceae bacterium]